MAVKQREWTVLAMLKWGTKYFDKKEIPNPRYSIEWLLAEVLGVKRLDLYLLFDRPLSKKELNKLRPLVRRREEHEPLQYITGECDFINAHLKVTPGVLIPRMETEQMVEIILKNHSADEPLSTLDIGTGSGCIAIALKMERPEWDLTAFDISDKAMTVAEENAAKNEVNIDYAVYDILANEETEYDDSFDLIVSNPPYILFEEKEILEPQVEKYEPATALFTEDIVLMYRRIIEFADEALASKGDLYLEIHTRQKNKIVNLFDANKWNFNKLTDYGGSERFIHARKER